jgi:hypothetical protein
MGVTYSRHGLDKQRIQNFIPEIWKEKKSIWKFKRREENNIKINSLNSYDMDKQRALVSTDMIKDGKLTDNLNDY